MDLASRLLGRPSAALHSCSPHCRGVRPFVTPVAGSSPLLCAWGTNKGNPRACDRSSILVRSSRVIPCFHRKVNRKGFCKGIQFFELRPFQCVGMHVTFRAGVCTLLLDSRQTDCASARIWRVTKSMVRTVPVDVDF